MNSKTGDTPFNLAFGLDVVILVEIEINSLRVAHFNLEQNESNLRANLDLLKEIMEDSNIKATARQRQIAQYYNKRVKIKTFKE